MIVGAPLPVAVCKPGADVAVIDGLGVRGRDDYVGALGDRRFELRADETHISRVVRGAIGLARGTAPWRHDVEVLRLYPLSRAQQLGVETQLKNRAPASLLGQLGVDGFVGPGPRALPVGLQQNVGNPRPSTVAKRALDDDILPGPHRGKSRGHAVGRTAQVEHIAPLTLEPIDISLLVSKTPFTQDVDQRIRTEGPLARPKNLRHLQPRELPAGEGVGDVGGGQDQAVRRGTHGGGTLDEPQVLWGPSAVRFQFAPRGPD